MEVELMDGDEAGVVRNNYSKVVEVSLTIYGVLLIYLGGNIN